MRFRDLSIRKKLSLMLMGVSTVALLTACLCFYFLIVDRYQQSYLEDLRSLADITGTNCSASLAFGVPEDARQRLDSLQKRPSIVAAAIHDRTGHLFASYIGGENPAISTGMQTAAMPKLDDPHFLSVSEKIELNGRQLGQISLYDDMGSLRSFKRIALLLLSAIVIVVLLITAFFASRLCEIISKPISNLADLAKKISTKQDYSLRASKEGADEIGNLVDSFNAMLAQIAERNSALQESEKRFRALINQAADSFFLFDQDGNIVDVNRQACDSLGYSRQELLAMKVADIDAGADNIWNVEIYFSRMTPGSPLTLEGTYRRKNGESFQVEARMGVLELGGEKLIQALVRDTSERLASEEKRLQLEVQLQQAQKMESIGTLAGGIAHDFNNILTPVFGYLDLALSKIPRGSTVTNDLRQVMQAAERAREMVKQILAFSRRDIENISAIDPQAIVKETLKLLKASLPATIEIRQNIDGHCGAVLANPTQIHQVLMNLCTNAYHAMREKGGILAVSMKPMQVTSRDFIKNINLKPGHYLKIEVSDTGHGISKEIQERIFEPYFTTKAKGEGTGMGLSVVHGIVKGLGGHISVYSEPGKGTAFHIYLPVIESSLASRQIPEEGPLPGGTERIMLIDDEEPVRNVEKALLANQGYAVSPFDSPLEALAAFEAQPEIFDLVITDMTMPKMTGDKLARKILAIRAEMPVILCTGFSDLINEKDAKSMGIREYVTKPVEARTLCRTVRNVLDGSA